MLKRHCLLPHIVVRVKSRTRLGSRRRMAHTHTHTHTHAYHTLRLGRRDQVSISPNCIPALSIYLASGRELVMVVVSSSIVAR